MGLRRDQPRHAERAGIPLAPMGKLERVMGIEPTLSAWEAEVLPLNYTREAAR